MPLGYDYAARKRPKNTIKSGCMNNQKLRDRWTAAMLSGVAAFAFSPTTIAQSVSPGTMQSQGTPVPPGQRSSALETIVVTARLRQEDAEAVPISLSVVNSTTLEKTYTNNISQLTSLVPSLNYVSPNPRNTAFTIRGLGSSVVAVSQSNDGLEPGVGFYVDQVYHARPATAAFDFVDLDRVDVLRGPQGTLFGKNTTAGAINIVTKAPTFDRELNAEVSAGNLGYYQAKASLSGALIDNLMAGRISAITTGRDGVIIRTVMRRLAKQRGTPPIGSTSPPESVTPTNKRTDALIQRSPAV
jgi:iron complex outermembrane receptor protein